MSRGAFRDTIYNLHGRYMMHDGDLLRAFRHLQQLQRHADKTGQLLVSLHICNEYAVRVSITYTNEQCGRCFECARHDKRLGIFLKLEEVLAVCKAALSYTPLRSWYLVHDRPSATPLGLFRIALSGKELQENIPLDTPVLDHFI